MAIALTNRQETIVEIVRENGPITGDNIASRLHVTRAALRPDLAILTMVGLIDARPKVGYFYLGKSSLDLEFATLNNLSVRDIHSLPVIVAPATSVHDAVVTMFLEDVGTVFVGEQGTLAGVVSRKDILKIAIGQSDLKDMPVKMIMTAMPNLVTTTMEEDVLTAARKLIDHEIDSLPVVRPLGGTSREWEVVGRVSKTNITRLFVDIGEKKRRLLS